MQTNEVTQVVLFATIATTLVSIMMAAFAVLFLRDRSRSRYDDEKHRAVLSDVRENYEAQIAKITSALVATEERWRDANHLILSAQNRQVASQAASEASQAVPDTKSAFAQNLGVDPSSITIDQNLVFMLTPFSKEENATYKVVQKVCTENGLSCVRGDETHVTGDILPHIVRLILKAQIIVANVTSRNPNVFYELGLAHSLNKQTILLSRSMESVPFDIQSKRVVLYSSLTDLEAKMTSALLRAYRERDVSGQVG